MALPRTLPSHCSFFHCRAAKMAPHSSCSPGRSGKSGSAAGETFGSTSRPRGLPRRAMDVQDSPPAQLHRADRGHFYPPVEPPWAKCKAGPRTSGRLAAAMMMTPAYWRRPSPLFRSWLRAPLLFIGCCWRLASCWRSTVSSSSMKIIQGRSAMVV